MHIRLSHDESPALKDASALHEGRDLFFEGRCIRCHVAKATVPEAAMDAPALTGIGGRRNEAWLTRGANGVTAIPRPLHAWFPGRYDLFYLILVLVAVGLVYGALERVPWMVE